MGLSETLEQGKLLNKAVQIIDQLSKNSIADADNMTVEDIDEDTLDEIKKLIMKARGLTAHPHWSNIKNQK